jgi:metal-responsive CopG/Arc/MetJ family transcriptional regulator
MTKYINIKVPEELADMIDEVIKKHTFGFRSRGEFVNEAIRKRLEDIKKLD